MHPERRLNMRKSQLNLYVSEDLGSRIDELVKSYNESAWIGKINSRGEFVEYLVESLERYQESNGEIKSFFDLMQ